MASIASILGGKVIPSQFTLLNPQPHFSPPQIPLATITPVDPGQPTNFKPRRLLSAGVEIFGCWQSTGLNTTTPIVNGIPGPDGTLRAQHMLEDTSALIHGITATNISVGGNNGLTGLPLRFSVIAKAAERTRMVLSVKDSSLDNTSSNFDLSGGTTNFDVVEGANVKAWPNVGTCSSMTAVGNGYYLCQLDVRYLGSPDGTFTAEILMDDGAGASARSTTYTGVATSGINLFWASVLPKFMWTHNWGTTFSDDFNSSGTIDLADTQQPGFNWYIHQKWPLSLGGSLVFNAPTTPTSYIDVRNSVCQLYAATMGGNITMASACTKLGDATQFTGFMMQPPFICESSFTFQQRVADELTNGGSGGWYTGPLVGTPARGVPCFWSLSFDGLNGNNFGCETDFMEAVAPGATRNTWPSNMHEFTQFVPSVILTSTVAGGGIYPTFRNEGPGDAPNITSLDDIGQDPLPTITGIFTRCAGVHWPTGQADANNLGGRLIFQDGQCKVGSLITYAPAATYSTFDTSQFLILLGGGAGTFIDQPQSWPMAVDWVRVYQ